MITIGRIHLRWIYVVPSVHLCICLVVIFAMLVPSLSYIAIIFESLWVLDFPISVVAFMLVWQHGILSYLWILIVGTLWWYLLCLGVSKIRGIARGDD